MRRVSITKTTASIIIAILVVNAIWVLMYIEQTKVEEAPQTQTAWELREISRRIYYAIQEFLNEGIEADDRPELKDFYNILKAEKATAILFYPSTCSSCIQYKQQVWDNVKREFNNITFIEYDTNSPTGFFLASYFGIPGVTVVLSYNGTIFSVNYGEHISAPNLANMLRVFTLHTEEIFTGGS